jgi:hypothetical protein
MEQQNGTGIRFQIIESLQLPRALRLPVDRDEKEGRVNGEDAGD